MPTKGTVTRFKYITGSDWSFYSGSKRAFDKSDEEDFGAPLCCENIGEVTTLKAALYLDPGSIPY